MFAESSIDPLSTPPGALPPALPPDPAPAAPGDAGALAWLRCPKCREPLAEIVAHAGWERLRIGSGFSTGDKTKVLCKCGAVKVFYPRRVL